MHHRLLAVHTDVRLGAEVPLVALLRLMHLRVALAAGVLRRTGRMNNRRVHNGASRDADVRGLRAGESLPAPQPAGPAKGVVSLETGKRPQETKKTSGNPPFTTEN